MSRPCFLVPGILGSELHTEAGPFFGTELWLGYGRLAAGQFRRLGLATDGVSPHPEFGQLCTPGLPLPAFYGMLSRELRRQLPNREVIDWGYDWRLRIETTGEQLATAIRVRATPADPAEIVAHSQGGLLARVAWRSLVQTGQTSLVRRIVSLGTPWNDGSYAAAVLWAGDDPELVFLYIVSSGVSLLRHWTGSLFGFPSLEGLVQVTATWPAVYELLPPPLPHVTSPPDPDRGELYVLANWPVNRGIDGAHLLHAGGAWRLILNDPASQPPNDVLTCIAGEGWGTPVGIRDPSLLGQDHCLRGTFEGDGRVPLHSALAPGGRNVIVRSQHGDIILHPTVLESIGEWVSEPRAPAPPADPVHLGARMPPTTFAPLGPIAIPHRDVFDC